MLSRENSLTLLGTLATASLTAIGLKMGGAGEGSIYATLMANIGINLASNIIQAGSLNLKQRWLNSNDGLLNHDIQKALARALIKALSSLERKYFETKAGKSLKQYEKESIRDLFRDFRENVENTLPQSIDNIRVGSELQDYFFRASSDSRESLWKLFGGEYLLREYGSEFQEFIRRNLLEEANLWFAEELKTDSRESNRAWRAFQRMLLEGIYADLKEVRASQDLITKDLIRLDELKTQLTQLQSTIDRRLPNEPFQAGLEEAVVKLGEDIERIAVTNQRIDTNVESIRADVKKLVEYHEKETPGRQRFAADHRAAYKELWTRLQEVHIKLRTEEVDLETFRHLLREVNSFLLRQSLLIEEEDRTLAARYLQALYQFKEALFDTGDESAKDAWADTAPVPKETISMARQLRQLDAEVKRQHDLLAAKCLQVISE